MAAYDLSEYDGVLAFGDVLRDLYLTRGWAARAFTWREAADVRVFRPIEGVPRDGDVAWIGNWGDGERSGELLEFLLRPAAALRLRGRAYGVRYPESAREALCNHGFEYGGWLPNFEVPNIYARFTMSVHVPRRPYVQALPGIPTIRPFEALACGIPLICAPWNDAEHLFEEGADYLVARTGEQMRDQMRVLHNDDDARRELAAHGRATILARHTCAHRVDDLLEIAAALAPGSAGEVTELAAATVPHAQGTIA